MYMLDTNICIYIIKSKAKNVLGRLKQNWEKGLYISTITLAELEFGNANTDSSYKEKNRLALLEFLTIIGVKYFDELAAIEYGALKNDLKDSNNLLRPFDLLIAAHAKSLNMTLITNNIREFERIQNLKIENWV